jgi:hypothetical protein
MHRQKGSLDYAAFQAASLGMTGNWPYAIALLTCQRRAPDSVDQYVRNLKFHFRFLKRKHAALTPEHVGWACHDSDDRLM